MYVAHRITSLLVLTASLILSLPTIATEAAAFVSPQITEIASVSYCGKSVGISRAASTDDIAKSIFFIMPPFCIIEPKSPLTVKIDDQKITLPKFINEYDFIDDLHYVSVSMQAITDQLRTKAIDTVLALPLRDLRSIEGFNPADIDMRSWPVTKIYGTLYNYHKGIDTKIYVSDSRPVNLGDKHYTLIFIVNNEGLENLFKAYENKRLGIYFSVDYPGAIEDVGSISAVVSGEIDTIFETRVNSVPVQGEMKNILLQEDVDAAKTAIKSKVRASITATSESLFKEIAKINIDNLSDDILDEISIDLNDSRHTYFQNKVADWLQPLIESEKATNTTTDSTTDTKQAKVTVEVGASASTKSGGKLSGKVKKEDLEKLEKKHSLSFKKETGTERYIPVTIKIYQKRSNSIEYLQNTYKTFRIAKRAQAVKYLPHFSKLNNETPHGTKISMAGSGSYSTVPIGAALCYFGSNKSETKPPAGYVWLSDENVWPNATWVDEKMIGQRLPSMNNQFLIGTQNINEVGKIIKSQKIDLKIINSERVITANVQGELPVLEIQDNMIAEFGFALGTMNEIINLNAKTSLNLNVYGASSGSGTMRKQQKNNYEFGIKALRRPPTTYEKLKNVVSIKPDKLHLKPENTGGIGCRWMLRTY